MALSDREEWLIEDVLNDGATALHARMLKMGKNFSDDPGYAS